MQRYKIISAHEGSKNARSPQIKYSNTSVISAIYFMNNTSSRRHISFNTDLTQKSQKTGKEYTKSSNKIFKYFRYFCVENTLCGK